MSYEIMKNENLYNISNKFRETPSIYQIKLNIQRKGKFSFGNN